MMKGFTLIETVVVVALFVLIVSFLVPMFVNFDKYIGVQQAGTDVVDSANAVASAVHSDVDLGSAILASQSISGTTYTSGTTTLVLALPSIDSSGDILSGDTDYVIFYATSTKVYEIISANASSARTSGTTTLASDLSSLVFTYAGVPSASPSVDVDVSTSETVRGVASQTQVHEKTYLRN